MTGNKEREYSGHNNTGFNCINNERMKSQLKRVKLCDVLWHLTQYSTMTVGTKLILTCHRSFKMSPISPGCTSISVLFI